MQIKNSLLILPFLILSTAAAGCRCEAYNFGDGDLKTLHEKTFPISPGKELKLDVSMGDVMISGWDKDEGAPRGVLMEWMKNPLRLYR